MSISGIMLEINDYGLEFDSFLGAIYLPWHTLITAALITIGYKVYKVRRDKW
jgi:hypothetical protein